jgi:hypothetical protein
MPLYLFNFLYLNRDYEIKLHVKVVYRKEKIEKIEQVKVS